MTTLNEYIIQTAGRGEGDEFLRQFGATEVFFSIQAPSEDLKDGPLVTSPQAVLQMQVAHVGSSRMALFYTARNDPRLSQRFGGLSLIKAAEMISDMSGVDGILIQSDSDAWFAADKIAIKQAIGQRRSAPLS